MTDKPSEFNLTHSVKIQPTNKTTKGIKDLAFEVSELRSMILKQGNQNKKNFYLLIINLYMVLTLITYVILNK